MDDILCEYGCGQPATFFFPKANKHCCSPHYRKCPHQARTIGLTRIGKKHNDDTKAKIGRATKERLERDGHPMLGVPMSEERKRYQSEVMKGKPGWSKGLTSETDDRVKRMTEYKRAHPKLYSNKGAANGMYGKTHTEEVKQLQREKNLQEKRWVGENNYWYGQSRAKELSPRYLPEKTRRAWETYKSQARYWSEIEYALHTSTINPKQLPRGMHEYHLDHIVPLWYGFLNGVDPKMLSKKENLRMLWCRDNQRRSKDTLDQDGMVLFEILIQGEKG